MRWRDWHPLARLDRMGAEQLLWPAEDPIDRVEQARSYAPERVRAAAAFVPNLPAVAGPGPWGWYVAAWRWWEKRKRRSLAENFILAVTDRYLVAIKTDYWTGSRVKRRIGMWARSDLVVTQAGLEGDGGSSAWAMKVEDRATTGCSFEAKPFRLNEEAVTVFQLLTDGGPPRT